MRTMALALLGAMALGCGTEEVASLDASIDGPSEGGVTDSSPFDDASLADGGFVTPPIVCPSTPPTVGSSCASVGETCEYGGSWWIGCNLGVTCGTDHVWSASKGSSCFGDASACPATYAAALEAGAPCPQADCDYPEGHCTCLGYCGGPPPPGPTPKTFHCAPTPSGCPTQRPLSGTACNVEGKTCDYSLGCCGGTVLVCHAGVWLGKPAPGCL